MLLRSCSRSEALGRVWFAWIETPDHGRSIEKSPTANGSQIGFEKVKLPFKLDSPGLINEEQRPDTESEEVKRLKEEIERLKGTNAKGVNDLQSLCHNFVDLKKDYEEKTKAYEELMRKQKAERDYTFRIKHDLAAANTELSMRAQE